MPGVNVVVGNDGVNNLSGSAGNDLIYGFDPNGPQSNVNSIAATRVATGLSGALFATAAPEDSQRLFIVQQNGTVRVLDLDSGQLLPTPFITLPVDSAGERGLLGMTFDPDYATNGFVYFYQTVTTGGTHNEIVRYHVNPANPNVVDATTPTTNRAPFSGNQPQWRLDRLRAGRVSIRGGWRQCERRQCPNHHQSAWQDPAHRRPQRRVSR